MFVYRIVSRKLIYGLEILEIVNYIIIIIDIQIK
jgi:hypothetical protein